MGPRRTPSATGQEYLYNIYDSTTHVALGQSPREAFELGLARTRTTMPIAWSPITPDS